MAINYDDLTDGTLAIPINVTEFGTAPTGTSTVWTGTDEFGDVAFGENALGILQLATCSSWNPVADPILGVYFGAGVYGLNSATDPAWTNRAAANNGCLTNAKHLYCVEQ